MKVNESMKVGNLHSGFLVHEQHVANNPYKYTQNQFCTKKTCAQNPSPADWFKIKDAVPAILFGTFNEQPDILIHSVLLA